MKLNEIDEQLETQFGKRTSQYVADANRQYCLNLIKSRMKGGKVDPDVEKPSVDALTTTILAVTKYPNKTFEELSSHQPAIKRSLLYCFVRGYDNYDEVHELVVSCLKKFAKKELNIKSVQTFLNYIKIVGNMKPTKFIDCVNYPERYDVILKTLHHLIDNEGDENAALVIISAQEDTLIKPTAPRKAFITEFNLNKSGFEKYMTMYMNGKGEKDIQKKKELIKESLRNLIKYTMIVDGGLRFKHGIKKRDILKLILNFLKR